MEFRFLPFLGPSLLSSVAVALLTGCSDAPTSSATEKSGPAEERYIRNRIKWQTASEESSFGYFLVRSDSENGPFEKVNARPIPGRGTTDEIQSYEIVDEHAVPGARYFYKIQELKYDNRTRDFSPVFPYQTPES